MNRFQVDFDLDDEEENALLASHLEDVERGFDFLLTPHLDRRVRRLGVGHRNYVGRLMQRGGGAPLPPEGQQIGTNGTSTPTCHTRTTPPRSRSPIQ